MKKVTWNRIKAQTLSKDITRGQIGFEDCVIALEEGRVLADIVHPGEQYAHQRMLPGSLHKSRRKTVKILQNNDLHRNRFSLIG